MAQQVLRTTRQQGDMSQCGEHTHLGGVKAEALARSDAARPSLTRTRTGARVPLKQELGGEEGGVEERRNEEERIIEILRAMCYFRTGLLAFEQYLSMRSSGGVKRGVKRVQNSVLVFVEASDG